MKKRIALLTVALMAGVFLLSMRSKPDKAEAVRNFDITQYVGKWYEIARLDFKYERNMSNTTAEYSLYDNGCVRVVNKGYDTQKNKWKTAKAKAKFRGDPTVAELKVSFFGPFYSGYNVIALDENYRYAMVAGKNLDYLWLLSREKTIPQHILKAYLQQAQAIGYHTEDLVWVQHD